MLCLLPFLTLCRESISLSLTLANGYVDRFDFETKATARKCTFAASAAGHQVRESVASNLLHIVLVASLAASLR